MRPSSGIGVACLALALVGYVGADAYDVVPGRVTLAPVPHAAHPFPSAPGARADAYLAPAAPLSPLRDDARLPSVKALGPMVTKLVEHEWIGTSTSVAIADARTGEVLVSHDLDAAKTPASTAKLLTAVAAMHEIGPDRTFATTVVRGSTADEIVLVGGGDMMLSASAGDPKAVNGRAGLGDLAKDTAHALELAGDTTVTLRLDDTLFSGPLRNPGWSQSDVDMGYVAPIAPLAVKIAATRSDVPYPPRFADPALNSAQVLAAALAHEGITVTGFPTRVVETATGAKLASVRSAPLRDIVGYFLKHSDNSITEVVGRLVAIETGLPGSFEGATQAVLASSASAGINVDGAHLADCSGLADGSLLTARTLVEVLSTIVDPDSSALVPVAVGMPVGALDGTLADRFGKGPAAGLVRAKTGSLRGVSSLAGTVVDADGRQLVFVVLADSTPAGGQLGPRKVMDAFVDELAGCGCR